MAKISAYGPAATLTGVEMIPAVQGGATVRLTPALIATYAFSPYGVNTFPARGSTGALEPKPITDYALTLLDDVNAAGARLTLGAGTVNSVAVANATGITWAGGPITESGTLTPTLSANLQAWHGLATSAKQDADADLTAVAALSTTGMAARTGAGTWAVRTIAGTSGRITVTNGDGVAGAPTIDIPTTLITSGTYTPTLTNGGNVATSTPFTCQYLRTGNTVTVSGKFDLTTTAAAGTQSTINVSLPIASNLANQNELAGTAAGFAGSSVESCGVFGDSTNDRATVSFYATQTGSRSFFFQFTYRVQ
ncbi:hypothetical protein [Lysobacter panacisoli]|uniref:Tail fiber protein n=1 Tax=Lysobacter panacisoli TaxID=1255263 RepID=A0ABP9LFJ3_9GAMM|nr:hypothetical protein [Lysobacter panacisoli]